MSEAGFLRVSRVSGTVGVLLWLLGSYLGFVTDNFFSVVLVGVVATLCLAASHVASYRAGVLRGGGFE